MPPPGGGDGDQPGNKILIGGHDVKLVSVSGNGKKLDVQVDGKPFSDPILVGDAGAKNAQRDDKVVIDMVRFPSHTHAGEGVIVEVLGPRGKPGVDTLSIIRGLNLPDVFAEDALEEARRAGIFGPGSPAAGSEFDIEIRVGAGAYICGEETALFESIEGKRGFPRVKPPFPTTHGLFGKPTVINNVETFCNVPLIVERSAAEYRKLGTERSPGPKLFCVSGQVQGPGI